MYRSASFRRHKCSRTTDPGVSLTLNPRLFIRSLRLASRPVGRHPDETERWRWRCVRTKTQGCIPYQGPGVSLTLNPRLLIRSLRLASRPVGRHPDETERWWGGWWVQKNSDGGLAHRYFFWGLVSWVMIISRVVLLLCRHGQRCRDRWWVRQRERPGGCSKRELHWHLQR